MLPFIAGAIVGIAGVIAVQKRKEIKEKMMEGAEKAQEMASDVAETVTEKIDALKKSKDTSSEKSKEEVVIDTKNKESK